MSASFEIRVDNLPAFTSSVRRVPESLTMNLVKAADQSGVYGESIAKQHVAVWKGITKASIQKQPVVVSAGMVSVTVSVGVLWAWWLEHGRGPIEARPGGVLRFVARDGTIVFAKRVGPAAAQPFMQPAFDALLNGVAERFFNDAVAKTIAEFGGAA